MHCQDYLELISTAIDGELTASEEARLQAHLAECEVCLQVAGDFKVNRLLLHAMTPQQMPADGWSRLRNRLDALEVLPESLELAEPLAPESRPSRVVKPTYERSTPRGLRLALRAVASFGVAFTGLLLWLGYTDVDAPAPVAPAVAITVEASTLLRGHAVVQASNPMADRAAWSSLACSSSWSLHPEGGAEPSTHDASPAGFSSADNDADLL
jgi:anti-sigma factor RsiW